MPLQDDYQIRLSHFQGPLDLLLYLVKRHEVDIQDIPIHAITNRYLSFLKQIDSIEVDTAAEFLVMAATLVEIKSRTLAPNPVSEAGVPAAEDLLDPRHELVRQLVAYQRFRSASDLLSQIRHEYSLRYPIGGRRSGDEASAGDDETFPETDLEDLHILDLLEAYERIVSTIDFNRMGDHRVEYDDTPIALFQEDLVDQMRREPSRRMTLQRIFEGRTRGEMLGLFLALLELARQQTIKIAQERNDAEIEIELAEPAAA
ncbi:MAG: segregation/condensation protein A [Planctomycetota bacterium]|nr:segregation/condensation protein A [Planctomycetota bacterium]